MHSTSVRASGSRAGASVRFWLAIFLAGYTALAVVAALTLTTPVPYGDLTRIGLFSERAFGWTLDQAQAEPESLRGVPVAQADILVIGDSFSAPHLWQSALVRAGHGVATVYWDSIDESLCHDFDEALARSGFQGRLIIIESIERTLRLRLSRMQDCPSMQQPLSATSEPRFVPPATAPGLAFNWGARLASGWHTLRHTLAARSAQGSTAGFQVHARPVAEGCALFSHRLCGKALFFDDDMRSGQLEPEDLAVMAAFTHAHGSTPILWMVVPNKTTTYLAPHHSEAFARALAASGLGPDLFAFAATHKTRMRDFYLPNDTHLSNDGLLALGEFMLEAAQRRMESPTPPSSIPPVFPAIQYDGT